MTRPRAAVDFAVIRARVEELRRERTPRAADDFAAIHARLQELRRERERAFSVMDHLIQIAGVGAPDEPFMEGWTVLSALAAVTRRIRLATLATSVGYRNPAHLAWQGPVSANLAAVLALPLKCVS